MTVSMDKKYRQRNGRAFIVAGVCTGERINPSDAVIGWCETADGQMIAGSRRIDGTYVHHEVYKSVQDPTQYDLIEVVPDVVTFAHVYSDGSLGFCHSSMDDAVECIGSKSVLGILRTTVRTAHDGKRSASVEVLSVTP